MFGCIAVVLCILFGALVTYHDIKSVDKGIKWRTCLKCYCRQTMDALDSRPYTTQPELQYKSTDLAQLQRAQEYSLINQKEDACKPGYWHNLSETAKKEELKAKQKMLQLSRKVATHRDQIAKLNESTAQLRKEIEEAMR